MKRIVWVTLLCSRSPLDYRLHYPNTVTSQITGYILYKEWLTFTRLYKTIRTIALTKHNKINKTRTKIIQLAFYGYQQITSFMDKDNEEIKNGFIYWVCWMTYRYFFCKSRNLWLQTSDKHEKFANCFLIAELFRLLPQ